MQNTETTDKIDVRMVELPPLRMLLVWDNLAGHCTPDMVLWLVEHGGYELKPGSVISLGSLGELHPADAGHRISAMYRLGGKTMHVDLSLVP